jgi:hypothetical protein
LSDILDVARWARRMYETGEERFSPLLNIVFILEPGRFTGYLAAAKVGPARREYHSSGHEDQTDPTIQTWNEDAERRLRERGLA